MQRRTFLRAGVFAGLGTVMRGDGFGAMLQHAEIAHPIPVDPARPGPTMPANFVGLSYELAELADASFFSPANTELVAFFKRLSPSGVLRIGGNTSEFCWFRATPATRAIQLRTPPGDLSQRWMPHRLFVIEPRAIENLAGFLQATGWQAIYGLNYGNSTPERAATEAAFVASRLGRHLLFFQIGNEPDFYKDANNGVRPASWGFQDYVREWLQYADAISARVPQARFGGPDTGASSDWVIRFGNEVAPKLGSRLVTLTGHYYAEGPPDAPSTTTARLLRGDPRMVEQTAALVRAADAHGLQYRMTEGNSCYRGGKPGMSNAFAATLWGADYMLQLASLGCAGVNLHGGKSTVLSAGLGDHNPGAKILPAGQHRRTNGFYTPISSENGDPVEAMPLFYGMLFAEYFAGGQFLNVPQPANPECRLYVSQRAGRLTIGIINKSLQPATIRLRLQGTTVKAMQAMRLAAPSLSSQQITFGGARVAAKTADWKPLETETVKVRDGMLLLTTGTGAILLQEM
jgi:hypothetical protein